MSATADISKYRDYFRDLGRGERVEVLAIPSSNQNIVFQRSVSYLDQARIYTLMRYLFFFNCITAPYQLCIFYLCYIY